MKKSLTILLLISALLKVNAQNTTNTSTYTPTTEGIYRLWTRDFAGYWQKSCAVTVSFPMQCADQANIFSFSYNGHNYDIVKEKKNWIDAAACAVERGGHLVHFDDQAENTEVYQQIITGANVPSNYVVVNDGGGIAYVWTGASDINTEGTWLWDGDNNGVGTNFWIGQGTAGSGNGSPVGGAFVNWGCSNFGCEPDDFMNNQDAGGLALGTWPYGDPGEWNDISKNNQLYYVIEYEPAGVEIQNNTPEIKLYPNPATEQITILGLQVNNKYIELTVSQPDGSLVIKKQINSSTDYELNIQSLKPGLYFIDLQGDFGIYRMKFLKIK